jgi:hypothetical protein
MDAMLRIRGEMKEFMRSSANLRGG